jgi:uncharacterized protein (TIGR02246 family)
MTADERAIHQLTQTWFEETKRGDVEAVLRLMSDDVIFMVPGQEPFGKEAFAAASRGMKGMQFEGTSEIVELRILGDWAWLRNRIRLVITTPDGKQMARSGYTLTLLEKNSAGEWLLIRDANLLAPEKNS